MTVGFAETAAANSTILTSVGIGSLPDLQNTNGSKDKMNTKPFKLSRLKGLIGTTAHWWAVRYCFFTGKDDRIYRVTASLIGGGYLDLPADGRGLIVRVRDKEGDIEPECLKKAFQPMTYEESDALLEKIEKELGMQADSEDVKKLETLYNLS